MANQYKKQVWLVGIGLTALTVGAGVSSLNLVSGFQIPSVRELFSAAPSNLDLTPEPNSQVLALATQPIDRTSKLEAIANGLPSADRSRARYLLASDLIQQDHGGKALPWLAGLEQNYPVLAAQILAKRAQAYTSTGNNTKAAETWKDLLKQYPKDWAAAEALYALGKTNPALGKTNPALGKTNPQYWDQVLAEFPSHPRAVDIALSTAREKARSASTFAANRATRHLHSRHSQRTQSAEGRICPQADPRRLGGDRLCFLGKRLLRQRWSRLWQSPQHAAEYVSHRTGGAAGRTRSGCDRGIPAVASGLSHHPRGRTGADQNC